MKYILASASPRRKELLIQAGLSFEIMASNMEEKITAAVPSDIAMELAEQKALNIYHKVNAPNTIIIGADTIVVYRDEILGKPKDKQEAYDMLSMLADRTHQVYTGVSLVQMPRTGDTTMPHIHTFYEVTDVTLYPIDRSDLCAYVETGDSLDKAGAYGIQGPFAIHIKEIKGDYYNVVGLPIGRLHHELHRGTKNDLQR